MPVATITLVLAGADAETIERSVVAPIEDAVASVAGVRSIAARIETSSATMMIELDPARPVDAMVDEVRTALDATRRQLPAALEPPVIARPSGPQVVTLRLSGDAPAVLSKLATDRIALILERQVGVARVEVRNEVRTEMVIRPDPVRLATYGVTLHDLAKAVRGADDFRTLVVAERAGAPVRLADVAVFGEALANESTDLPELVVYAQYGARVPDVQATVRAALAEVRAMLPPAVTLEEVSAPAAAPRLAISVLGPDLDALERIAGDARAELASVAGLGEVAVEPSQGAAAVVFTPDRARAAELDIPMVELTHTLALLSGGLPLAVLTHDRGTQDVVLRALDDPKTAATALGAYSVRSARGVLVPLEAVVTARFELPRTITRRDRSRVVTLTCHGTDAALAAARGLFANRKLPAGYRFAVSYI